MNWCIIPSVLHSYIHLPSILPNLDSEYSNIKKKTQEHTISASTATSFVYISNMVCVAYQEDHTQLQIFHKCLFTEGIEWEISLIMRKVILPDTIINEYHYGLNSATIHHVKTYNWFRSSCESCGVPSWLTIFCIDETERYCTLFKHVHAWKYNFKLRELL